MLRKYLTTVMVMLMCMTGSMLYGVSIGAEQVRETTYTTYELNQDELFLDRKGEDYVSADGMRFEINSSTIIKNGMGKEISLEELSVPCKAIAEYYKMADQNNINIAVSIQEILIPE